MAENEGAQASFSNLTFSIGHVDKPRSRKDKRNAFNGKDYGRLLSKANKRQETIAKIRQENPQKAKDLESNIQWERALRKAFGEKVKDDPERLQRGLTRKIKRKGKSKTNWESRKLKEDEQRNKRQVRRQENIAKRKDIKFKKKAERRKKKRMG